MNTKYYLNKIKYLGLRKVYYLIKNSIEIIKVNYTYFKYNVLHKESHILKGNPNKFDRSYFEGNGSNYEYCDYPKKYFENEYFSKRIKYVSKFITTPFSGKKLLDIGCADGLFLDYCRKKGARTYGIDISKDMIKKGKSRYPFNKLYCIDAKDTYPFPKNYFDIITLFDLIEHTDNPNHVLKKIYVHLKKGGIAYIITPNGKQKADHDITHISLMAFSKARRILLNNSFNILDSYTYKYYPPNNYLFIQKMLKAYNIIRGYYIEQSVFVIQK